MFCVKDIAEMFVTVGMAEEAVEAYTKVRCMFSMVLRTPMLDTDETCR